MLFDWFSPITYHFLEYGGIDDVIINNILLLLSYKTSRLHASVSLFSNRSQIKSKCGTNKKVAYEAQQSVSLTLIPHFDFFCSVLFYRHKALL